MLQLYKSLSKAAEPLCRALLASRVRKGKEVTARLGEREGKASLPRPASPLIWIHAASVGESQSALILVDRLLKKNKDAHILMTTGTVSSANLMQKNLPAGVIHQFYPLDHPGWVKAFLDHWKPDLVLWMESELWPNMLGEIKARAIPAILVNARLSERSFKRWAWIRNAAKEMLGAFSVVLTQSEKEATRYKALGAAHVIATGNLKYSAKALPFNEEDLQSLLAATAKRPLWLFASTHKGEEAMACRIHQKLKAVFPDLLTIIVPRHPDRRADITDTCKKNNLSFMLRTEFKIPPIYETDIYIADTFGELGLFYRLAPAACIGRSFSDDGGGGHNPIEAAQLNCAVLYGPNVQFQKELFEEMSDARAAIGVRTEKELTDLLRDLLSDPKRCEALQQNGLDFTATKGKVIDTVFDIIEPWLELPPEKKQVRS